MKFSHEYKLNKDIPKYKKGWTLGWCGSKLKFFPYKAREHEWEDKSKPDIYLDYSHGGYTIDDIKNNEDFFSPVGKLVDFIPKFPSFEDIYDFVYLDFETRLVNDVDECRALNALFDSLDFKKDLYDFVKKEYNKFHNLSN